MIIIIFFYFITFFKLNLYKKTKLILFYQLNYHTPAMIICIFFVDKIDPNSNENKFND